MRKVTARSLTNRQPLTANRFSVMLTLVIGDKNLSSWSLRPWLVLRRFGLEFREVNLKLDTPGFQAEVSKYSGALRVPVLIDGDLHVWDSLAILEYVNEKLNGAGWPADPAERAQARSISAEMHSGFTGLRQTWPMHSLGTNPKPLTSEVAADVARIDAIWSRQRANYASKGPWLFGGYSIADAMYAPVVLRFNHYGPPPLSAASTAYCEHWLADEHMRAWIVGARAERRA